MRPVDKQNLQNLWGRIPVWGKLLHPNILPFRGVEIGENFNFSLIYDWGEEGNITKYLESNPAASRPPLVRELVP